MSVAEYELYKRIKLLGEGSFGKAYLVECHSDGSLCVIKQVDISRMTEQEKKDTLTEAKILEALQHPNIVRFREVYKTKKGRLCIVMDYADGGDLGNKIKERKGQAFPESQILDWFTQICLALKHVHDNKIIHRDLKCQNIFLTKTNVVKLGDFGIARELSNTREKAKTLVGTPYYLSPEIIENKPYSFKSDIWALGIILYELCALKPPFTGDSLPFLALKIVRGTYSPIPSQFSKDLKNLVSSLLQTDPNKRPTINAILGLSFIQARIPSFLSESALLAESPLSLASKQKDEVISGPMLSKMGIKSKPKLSTPKLQKVNPAPPHDENNQFENNFQTPMVYESKHLVDLVNQKNKNVSSKEEEKQALVVKQLNQHGLNHNSNRNQLLSKQKVVSTQNKALDQKNSKVVAHLQPAKSKDHEYSTDKSKEKSKAGLQNGPKLPVEREYSSVGETPTSEGTKQNSTKNQRSVHPNQAPKMADYKQSKESQPSYCNNLQEKKIEDENGGAKKDEIEKKRAEKEKERLALRQQMQLDIKNKRNQFKQAKGDFKVEFIAPNSEDQALITDRTVSTEETANETQRSERVENSTIETESDLKTVFSSNKVSEYSSVDSVKYNEGLENKKIGKDKERTALRQHIQSKRNSKRQGKDFVVEFIGMKIHEQDPNSQISKEPASEISQTDELNISATQAETDPKATKVEKRSKSNRPEEHHQQELRNTDYTDFQSQKVDEENDSKKMKLFKDPEMNSEDKLKVEIYVPSKPNEFDNQTENTLDKSQEAKSEETERTNSKKNSENNSGEELSIEESKECEEESQGLKCEENDISFNDTQVESQGLESNSEHTLITDESTKMVDNYEDRDDFEDELQTCRRQQANTSTSQFITDVLKIKEEINQNEGLDFISDYNKLETLKIFMEDSLGDQVFLKAYRILKDLFHKRANIDEIEKKYAQDNFYESLFPFISKESRVKYLPLMFTFVIMEDIAEETSA